MKSILMGLLAVPAVAALTGCSHGDTIVHRSDPSYTGLAPGFNEIDGKGYDCAYLDSTVVRQIDVGGGTTAPRTVAPGLRQLDRSDLIAHAKAGAIATLRSSAPARAQIGSCDLKCVPASNEERGGGVDDSAPTAAAGGGAKGGASQASTTNDQVAGVDEPDFIKNDTRYFYVLSGTRLEIIDAWPAETARVIANVELTHGTPTKLLLGNDRLVVFSSVSAVTIPAYPGGYAGGAPYAGGSSGECTYGYDCVPTGDGTATHVTILDITDRSAPKAIRELDLSGSMIAARQIGDAIHTVTYDPPFDEQLTQLTQPPQAERCYDRRDDPAQIAAEYRAQLDAQVAKIEALSGEGPSIHDGATPIEPEFRASSLPGNAFLSVVSFGLTSPAVRAESVLSKPGFVYASSDALYVSVPHSVGEGDAWYGGEWGNEAQASEVYKFAVGAAPEQTAYQASGIVKGSVLDQFAMDESGGNLRIATTTRPRPRPERAQYTDRARPGGRQPDPARHRRRDRPRRGHAQRALRG